MLIGHPLHEVDHNCCMTIQREIIETLIARKSHVRFSTKIVACTRPFYEWRARGHRDYHHEGMNSVCEMAYMLLVVCSGGCLTEC